MQMGLAGFDFEDTPAVFNALAGENPMLSGLNL